jgi:hypothetical protein
MTPVIEASFSNDAAASQLSEELTKLLARYGYRWMSMLKRESSDAD